MMERYEEMAGNLEDFWQRRRTETRISTDGHVFGHPFQLLTNDERLTAVVRYSAPLFSRAPALNRPPFQVQLVTSDVRQEAGPPPDSLFDHIWYSGQGTWLMLHLGPWGQAHVDLAAGRATAVLAPSLAARPDVVSHSLFNTILLNFCIYLGYGMLHASCLVREGRALLLLAPHNTGKSTTALHLVRAGYRLLTDSMVHLSPFHSAEGACKETMQTESRPLLCGFPVGKIKLRRDMLPAFPEMHALLQAEQVRDETKYTLDLRDLDKQMVVEEAFAAQEIVLCLLKRHEADTTLIRQASDEAVRQAVWRNSLFYDEEAVWQRNLRQLRPLLAQARSYQLTIGREIAGMVAAVDGVLSA